MKMITAVETFLARGSYNITQFSSLDRHILAKISEPGELSVNAIEWGIGVSLITNTLCLDDSNRVLPHIYYEHILTTLKRPPTINRYYLIIPIKWDEMV
jgi:hypothetical protein